MCNLKEGCAVSAHGEVFRHFLAPLVYPIAGEACEVVFARRVLLYHAKSRIGTPTFCEGTKQYATIIDTIFFEPLLSSV